jgi:hypothetical protein
MSHLPKWLEDWYSFKAIYVLPPSPPSPSPNVYRYVPFGIVRFTVALCFFLLDRFFRFEVEECLEGSWFGDRESSLE